MCVIIAKPTKARIPSIATIKACIATNPHGSALVWVKDGHLETFKTLKAEEMVRYYTDHFEELAKTAYVFHARIATHGSKNIKNCHGWKTDDGHTAFFHNGILNIASRGDLTDSETFLRDIYEPIALKSGHKKAEPAIRAILGTSKFAFLRDNGEIKLYGVYYKRDGCFFSNLNHEANKALRHYSYIDWWERDLVGEKEAGFNDVDDIFPWEK